ncbi:uncharacterized protein TNCV_4263621 [Trichonephila clavipes]|nr:uncharacterized protein TNCV_4263621 [Trichonephila clavipes]
MFETQKKLIELEEGHFAIACLHIEVSTDRGTIGNEVRSNLSSETRLKVEVEDRLKADEEAKAVEERRKMEEERRMNEKIALEEEMRMKDGLWKSRCGLFKRNVKQVNKFRRVVWINMPQHNLLWRKKGKREISGDVITGKYDLNTVILSKERMDFDEDEIEEEKPKLPKRKRKNLNRMTVAELQENVNLKASSNMVLIPQHWSFRGEYLQDKSEMGKLARKLTDFIKRDGTVKIRRSSRKYRMIRKRFRLKLRTHDNIYWDGKVRGKTRPLEFKIVDPAWMKQGVVRKLRKIDIEFQKRCFK